VAKSEAQPVTAATSAPPPEPVTVPAAEAADPFDIPVWLCRGTPENRAALEHGARILAERRTTATAPQPTTPTPDRSQIVNAAADRIAAAIAAGSTSETELRDALPDLGADVLRDGLKRLRERKRLAEKRVPYARKDRKGYRPAYRQGGETFLIVRPVVQFAFGRKELYPTRADAIADARDYLKGA
jgi:hypothetical protein